MSSPFTRRRFLSAAGACVALPVFESLSGCQKSPQGNSTIAAAASDGANKNFAVLYVPNGMIMDAFRPQQAGQLQNLPQILSPLEAYKNEIMVLSGLGHHITLRPVGGGHAHAATCFLTNTNIDPNGKRMPASMDQKIARHLGNQQSLHLGIIGQGCDSNFNCELSRNISWGFDQFIKPRYDDPKTVFETLFASYAPPAGEDPNRAKKSILDFVLDESKNLSKRLNQADQKKMDSWLTQVRQAEKSIATELKQCDPKAPQGGGTPVKNIPLMLDLMAMAFHCGQSRVATFMLGSEGNDIDYSFLNGVQGKHHSLSHHQGDPNKIAQNIKIQTYLTGQLTRFLDQLKTLGIYDETTVLFGAGLGDPNQHVHNDLPIVLAGGGFTGTRGQHLTHTGKTPLANLHVEIMRQFGLDINEHGNSTGALKLG